jgi:multiple sugar transport system substrate-binding protein
MKKNLCVLSTFAAAALALSACGGGSSSAEGGDGQIDYWLWDSNQLPAYQQCADDFQAANSDITVKITQRGWDDYWSTLTNGFVAGTAPDVFTNHVAKYPELAANDQLLALEDDVDTSIYNEGLADVWVDQEGVRYGMPKDWDTIGMFYNKAMTDEVGITAEDLAAATWNPEDGGTYEEIIARLTVDANGVRGNEEGFDKDNVAVYGLGLESAGSAQGQTQWSMYSGTTGWTHTDKNPWGTKYNFDDPRFQDTIAWWAGLIDKGYMPKLETTVGASVNDTFAAGKAAINTNGSWMTNTYLGYEGVEVGIAPTPTGPDNVRASMFNGLGDSIWSGTDNVEASTKWVQYLASPECQDVVAEAAVVFPAIKTSSEKAVEAFAAKGVDVSAFTTHVEEGTTFLVPITDQAAKIDGVMKPAMDSVLSGTADVSSLTDANNQINELLK